MESVEVASDERAVVVRGNFAPATFSPSWLAAQELIGPEDLSSSEIEVISPSATGFTCGDLKFSITPDLLQVFTAEPAESERVRDIALGILTSLKHVPVSALGLNRAIHFTPRSADEWHAIGDSLAPKAPWEEASVLLLPGMADLTLQGVRPDLYGGHVQIQVQPSAKFALSVYVAINDHYTLTRVESQPTQRGVQLGGASEMITDPSLEKFPIACEILANEWRASSTRSEQALDFVVGAGKRKSL